MIVNGKLDRILSDEHTTIVSFAIPNYQSRYLSELNKEICYKIEVKEIKSKRSLHQNRLMWELISLIAKESDIVPDEERIYMDLIKLAKIKTVYIQTVPEAKKELQKVFRNVIEKDTRTTDKGVTTIVYECYYGTSTFDVNEMTRFIEVLLMYAKEVGIDVREYQLK